MEEAVYKAGSLISEPTLQCIRCAASQAQLCHLLSGTSPTECLGGRADGSGHQAGLSRVAVWIVRCTTQEVSFIVSSVLTVTPEAVQWTICTDTCGHSEALGPAKLIAVGYMEMPGTQFGELLKTLLRSWC